MSLAKYIMNLIRSDKDKEPETPAVNEDSKEYVEKTFGSLKLGDTFIYEGKEWVKISPTVAKVVLQLYSDTKH